MTSMHGLLCVLAAAATDLTRGEANSRPRIGACVHGSAMTDLPDEGSGRW